MSNADFLDLSDDVLIQQYIFIFISVKQVLLLKSPESLFNSGPCVKGQSSNIRSVGGRKLLTRSFEGTKDHRTGEPVAASAGEERD